MARGSEIWRDFAVEGNPGSGANKPVKADIRTWSAWVESLQGIQWNFETSTTMAAPATGGVRYNSGTLASITAMAVSALSGVSGNPSVRSAVKAWDDGGDATLRGYLTIRKIGDPSVYAVFALSGSVADNTTWLQLTVTYVDGTLGLSANDAHVFNFSPSGPAGSASAGYAQPPRGRLTLTSGTPVLASDVTAASALYYTPYNGDICPIWDGVSRQVSQQFTEQTLTLNANHLANTVYDVFAFLNSGAFTIGTGPAWATSTAGSGARGSGAGTTQLARAGGLFTNAVAVTARNGATTYSVGANLATYLGTIAIGSVAGQVSCHTSWGQSRRWDVWNAFNRVPITLKCGDNTASWAAGASGFRAVNNAAANSVSVLAGLPEESFRITHNLKGTQQSSTGAGFSLRNGIGWNSTSASSGVSGITGWVGTVANHGDAGSMTGFHIQPPSIGVHVVTALEDGVGSSTNPTFFGTEVHNTLAAIWNG